MSINVDSIISTVAGIIEPSGDRLDFTGMVVTTNSQVPIGISVKLASLLQVKDYFGNGSDEAFIAEKYFLGFDNSTRKPAKIAFYHHSEVDTAGFVRGGSLDITLAELQSYVGTLSVDSDGDASGLVNVDLSGATSFSNAATVIESALNAGLPSSLTVIFNSVLKAFEIISGTVGITSTMAVTGGTIASNLLLLIGATTVAGSDPSTLTETLDSLVLIDRNWVGLITVFEPSITDKLEIATWSNSQNDDYLYVAHDTDNTALDPLTVLDFGSQLITASYDGTAAVFGGIEYAAFVVGMIASIDTSRDNGWITLAYKSQSGLLPNVSSTSDAGTLEGKRYNFYGDWASRSQNEKMLMHGAMAGNWAWIDDYLGQIYLRSGFQESGLSLLTQIRRLPYNLESYETLKAVWIGDVINPAIDIGIISAGVSLDTTQKVLIDSLTGIDDSGEIVANAGWFLDVSDPSANDRANRESPTIIFVYTSGQSIHRLHIPVFLAQ